MPTSMHSVYILQLSNKRIYIGSAKELQRRLREHKAGKVASTKKSKLHLLKWYCTFANATNAIAFERYLKSGSGFSWRKKHLGF